MVMLRNRILPRVQIQMVPRLIVNAGYFEGYERTTDDVKYVLENPADSVGDVDTYIKNMFLAYSAVQQLLLLLTDINMKQLCKYNNILTSGAVDIDEPVNNRVAVIVNDTVRVKSDLANIQHIRDVKDRAVTMFLYIMQNKFFKHFNASVACIAANKILIEEEFGIFEVPQSHIVDVRYKAECVAEIFCKSEIKDYLKSECILQM